MLVVAALLTVFGILVVYSASFAFGELEFGNPHHFVVRQTMSAIIGTCVLLVAMRLDYRRLRMLSLLMLLASMALLAATLVPGIGIESNGARRWIALGPFPPLQPSEFAKLALVIYIADWLSARGDEVKSFTLGVLPFVFVVGLIAALVMLEPDMGTMLILLFTVGTQFFLAGGSIRHVLALGSAGAVAAMLLITSGGYRAERFAAFLSPESDAAGTGFHVLQLLIALGSGGLTGVEWGESRQKFFYIPGAHTDGIFAILGEELGFMGALAVIILFGILVFRAMRIAMRSRDEFGFLLAAGIASWISYQALLNVGGITRSIPMTGVPLPFLSYGGSALVAVMAATGLLLSISRFSGQEVAEGDAPVRGRRRRVDKRVRREAGITRAVRPGGRLR